MYVSSISNKILIFIRLDIVNCYFLICFYFLKKNFIRKAVSHTWNFLLYWIHNV